MSNHTVASKKLDKLIALLCTSGSASLQFFGINCASMKRHISDDHKTMATNGRELWVNPDFLLSRSDSDNLFTLIHEAFHKVARHTLRLRDCAPGNQHLVHMAADYAINLALKLDDSIPYEMPADGLIDDRFVDDNGKALNAERILRILMDEATPIAISMSGGGQGDSDDDSDGQSGSGGGESGDDQQDNSGDDSGDGDDQQESGAGGQQDKPQDSGSNDADDDQNEPKQDSTMNPNSATPDSTGDLLPAPDDLDEQQIAMDNVKAETIAGVGAMPAYLKELVRESCETAKSDWMQEVRQELCRVFDKSDYSMRRPNQRYAQTGLIMPSLRNPAIRKLAVAIDTSGSMSADELTIAATQLKSIIDEFNPLETLFLQHDARVTYEESIPVGIKPKRIEWVGRGGTKFRPILDRLESEDIDGLIWITDMGLFDSISEPAYPVIWLNTSPYGQHYHGNNAKINFGRFIDLS